MPADGQNNNMNSCIDANMKDKDKKPANNELEKEEITTTNKLKYKTK